MLNYPIVGSIIFKKTSGDQSAKAQISTCYVRKLKGDEAVWQTINLE